MRCCTCSPGCGSPAWRSLRRARETHQFLFTKRAGAFRAPCNRPGTTATGRVAGLLRERRRPRREVDVDGVLARPDLDHLTVFEVQEHLVLSLEQFLTNDHDKVLPH